MYTLSLSLFAEYTEMVNNLQVAFEKATKKYFESNSSDDERNAEYPDLKTNVFREKNFNAKNVVTPKPALLNELAATKLKDALHHEAAAAAAVAAPSLASIKSSSKSSAKTNKPAKKEPAVVHAEPDAASSINNASRGTKRKRKDKDKKKKKKSKTNIDKDTEVDDKGDADVVDTVPVAVATRPPTDDEDEDAWEYDKPPKHIKKKKKNAASSKKTGVAKIKSKGHKDKKAESDTMKDKASPSKRKQKIDKKKEYSSEEEQLDQVDEDEDRENRKRSKSGSNQTSKSSPKVLKTSEKAGNSLPKLDRRDSTVSHKNPKQKAALCERNPDELPAEATSDADDLSLSSDDALFNFPMATSSIGADKTKKTKPKPKAAIKAKQNSESAKPKGKAGPMIVETKRDDRDRSRSPVHRSRTPSSTSSRSNSPAVFTVDLHKKYSQSASTRTFVTPTKSKPPPPTELMSVSSGSRNSSPVPSNTSTRITSKAHPTNHDRIKLNPRTQNLSASPLARPCSPVCPSTPEIRNKYDLIKERRSRNNEASHKGKLIKDAVDKSKDSTQSTSNMSSQKIAALTALTSAVPALSETIEKLKAKNKSTKQRSAMLSEILGGKKAAEVRTEKEIWEQLSTDATVKQSEPKKKKRESVKKEKPIVPAMLPPPVVDEYHFVDDLLIDPPTGAIPVPNTKEAPTAKLTKSGAARKPRAPKTLAASAPAITPPVPKPTNLEALELETEQTLKDINRWLEHTPRFSDFNSASNSPSRYNLLDDFEAVTAKLEAEFQRPIIEPPTLPPVKQPTIDLIAGVESTTTEPSLLVDVLPKVPEIASIDLKSPTIDPIAELSKPSSTSAPPVVSTTSVVPPASTPKTIQLIGMMPAPGTQKREAREKKKSLKEKSAGAAASKRKDSSSTSASNGAKDSSGVPTGGQHHHRGGIDRLQPGKTKGNLMKSEDLEGSSGTTSALHNSVSLTHPVASKSKEVKNSLMQPESDTGPKLSLGSVLDTAGFGLGMQHNFGDDEADTDPEKG